MDKKVPQVKRKKKRKLRVKLLLKLALVLCLIVVSIVYIKTLKIKNIYITGNNTVKDVEIIEAAGIKNYPKIYKLKTKKIKNKILENPLIEEVSIKRNIFGKLTIKVKESKVLFFYKYNNKYITSSGSSLEDSNKYYGYPTLINFTPDTVFEELLKGLNKIDNDIVKMIDQIEYNPNPYKVPAGTDNHYFTLIMNDGNTVIIDLVNIKNLNSYNIIYASLGLDENKGIIYLDTITEDKIYFTTYETVEKEKAEAAEKEKEKENEVESETEEQTGEE